MPAMCSWTSMNWRSGSGVYKSECLSAMSVIRKDYVRPIAVNWLKSRCKQDIEVWEPDFNQTRIKLPDMIQKYRYLLIHCGQIGGIVAGKMVIPINPYMCLEDHNKKETLRFELPSDTLSAGLAIEKKLNEQLTELILNYNRTHSTKASLPTNVCKPNTTTQSPWHTLSLLLDHLEHSGHRQCAAWRPGAGGIKGGLV